jgi:hypothetical protein
VQTCACSAQSRLARLRVLVDNTLGQADTFGSGERNGLNFLLTVVHVLAICLRLQEAFLETVLGELALTRAEIYHAYVMCTI